MNTHEHLAILVPDGAYPLVLQEFLDGRAKSLGLRRVPFVIKNDPFRDSSREAVDLLRPFQRQSSHAMIIRDLHGSGWESRGAHALESSLKEGMVRSGWAENQCCAIVVEPEIEAWMRFDSTHIHRLVRERARKKLEWDDLLLKPLIDEIIVKNGGSGVDGKPLNPKEVFEDVLRYFGIQRSNALYGQLARAESLKGCVVPSFQRLTSKLKAWFPANG